MVEDPNAAKAKGKSIVAKGLAKVKGNSSNPQGQSLTKGFTAFLLLYH